MNVIVNVSALVYPTEMEEKVKTAINNIVQVDLDFEDFGVPRLYGEGNIEHLRKLHLLLREERILDTARHIFLTGIEGNTIQFCMSKQVAFVGKVNFPAGEESLGSIDIEIFAENKEELMRIIDWLAPETIDGKPAVEIEL
ncbi:MAG: hypothetical protein FIB08_00170 [Candidatus Methanoperedens sp.]|nr:hypothetical protein [Candidatus Methanoperedens sp.]